MIPLKKTDEFDAWLNGLRDGLARARIDLRLDRLASGNPGQHRVLQGGIRELKIDYGPGYRVYYREHRNTYILLLCGGDKKTQQLDIRRARVLAARLE